MNLVLISSEFHTFAAVALPYSFPRVTSGFEECGPPVTGSTIIHLWQPRAKNSPHFFPPAGSPAQKPQHPEIAMSPKAFDALSFLSDMCPKPPAISQG